VVVPGLVRDILRAEAGNLVATNPYKPGGLPERPTITRLIKSEIHDMAVAQRKQQSDTELVSAAQRGDRLAFEALYRSYVGRIFALCVRLTASRDDAESLTQDAFVHAWNKLDRFAGQSAFGTWLHRLTVNLMLDRRRADQRRRKHETPMDPDEQAMALRATAAPARVIDRLELERAIAGLPEGARTVFVLQEIEGYPVREIAGMMGIAEGTVKAQGFRARRLLREVLS